MPPPLPDEYPTFRTHLRPRTRKGWVATITFLVVFAFCQPPLVFVLGNRIEPRVFGAPFLWGYLLLIYCVLIGVLIWTERSDV